MPPSAAGATYILEAAANLSDGRVLKLNAALQCKPRARDAAARWLRSAGFQSNLIFDSCLGFRTMRLYGAISKVEASRMMGTRTRARDRYIRGGGRPG